MRLHHVQVSCPPGGEALARRFWVDGVGLSEVAKPPELRARGGAWFRAHDSDGAVAAEVHVGAEAGFAPARKAHPALLLDDALHLVQVGERLTRLGFEVDSTERNSFPGYTRLHVRDGHANRVELLAQARTESQASVR